LTANKNTKYDVLKIKKNDTERITVFLFLKINVYNVFILF